MARLRADDFAYDRQSPDCRYHPATGKLEITSGVLARQVFKTPSGAAIAVVRAHNPGVKPNRNGWTFWVSTRQESSCSPSDEEATVPVPVGSGRAFLDDLLGAWRQGRADLGREVEEALVAGELLQGRPHQAAGVADIAALVRELGLEELKLRPAKGGVAGQPVEAVLPA